jgi:hypothetical protein
MILGCLLTIGAEIALVMMGVNAVTDSLQTISGTAGSTPVGSPSLENLSPQQLLAYCGTKWEKEYPRIARVCEENRTNERINEKLYKQRTGQ